MKLNHNNGIFYYICRRLSMSISGFDVTNITRKLREKYFITNTDQLSFRETLFINNTEILLFTNERYRPMNTKDSNILANALRKISQKIYAICISNSIEGFCFRFYDHDPYYITYSSKNFNESKCSLWVRFLDTSKIMFTCFYDGNDREWYPTVIYPSKWMEPFKDDNIIDVFYKKILPDIYDVLGFKYVIKRNDQHKNIKKASQIEAQHR